LLSESDREFSERGGQWINADTFAADSKGDLNRVQEFLFQDDLAALGKMIRQGQVIRLSKGAKVYIGWTDLFRGKTPIRIPGQTDSWWVSVDTLSSTPISTTAEELSKAGPDFSAPKINQKALPGELSVLKLPLNQPLSAWRKALATTGTPAPLSEYVYNFLVGKYQVTALITGEPKVVTSVQIAPQNNDVRLSSKEANQIMASFELTNPVKDNEGWLKWGKEGDIISGYYDGDTLNIDTGMKPKK
jgi:hypothetical protein